MLYSRKEFKVQTLRSGNLVAHTWIPVLERPTITVSSQPAWPIYLVNYSEIPISIPQQKTNNKQNQQHRKIFRLPPPLCHFYSHVTHDGSSMSFRLHFRSRRLITPHQASSHLSSGVWFQEPLQLDPHLAVTFTCRGQSLDPGLEDERLWFCLSAAEEGLGKSLPRCVPCVIWRDSPAGSPYFPLSTAICSNQIHCPEILSWFYRFSSSYWDLSFKSAPWPTKPHSSTASINTLVFFIGSLSPEHRPTYIPAFWNSELAHFSPLISCVLGARLCATYSIINSVLMCLEEGQ